MKKLFLLITTILLAFTITACKEEEEPPVVIVDDGITSIVISGVTDQTIMVDDVFNVFTGVVATGSDGLDYSSEITADSDNCTINADGSLDTAIQAVCIINYAIVVNNKLDTAVANITIDKEEVIVDTNAPLVMGWTFDTDLDADALLLSGWSKYENGDGAVVGTVVDGALKLEMTSGGNIWEPRFEYMGIALEQGVDYVVSFKAKADTAGKILHLQFGALEASEFDAYFTDFKRGQTETVVLTTEWVEYSYSFTMTLVNFNGGPLFEMGDYEGSMDIDTIIYIDDLEIRGGSDVDENPPTIGGVDDVSVFVGDTFDTADGVTAIDFVDGDVLSTLVIAGDAVNMTTAGVYNVTYYAIDTSGNDITVTRVVTVVADVDAPVFSGVDDKEVAVDATFDPLTGVSALDNRDGVVTANIVVTGDTVDTAIATEYTVTYTVEDADGNSVSVDRVITVAVPDTGYWGDAELILNGDFETASAWNYWIEPMGALWSGADTEAYLTFWGGAMHAEIIKGGGAGWAIQAYQVVELETTKTYKVTFDAKADEARDISAWVGFGADADWHPYGGEAVVSLTDAYQTFTFMIVVDVDPLVGDVAQDVQMKFEFGGSVINAEIDNVMIEEYDTVAELVVVDSDLVVEGDFETDPTSPWEREGAWWNGVTTSFGIEDGVGVLKFSDDSICAYCAQIVYNDIDFVEGETYKVTFDAKVLVADQMQINFWDADDSVNMTGEVLAVTTEWQTFEAIITYTQSTGGSLQMQIGSLDESDDAVITPNILYIDNVMIEKELEFIEASLIENGDFEMPAAWNYWIEPMGAFWSGADTEAYLTFWGGAMHAEIIKGGGAGWAIQAYQVVELETTKTYKVTFDAKADEARDIAAWVGFGADADWHPYGGEAVVSLTDTYQTFTFMIVVDVDPLVGDVAQDVQMKFEFGGSVINAEIDNVMIEEYDTVAEAVVVDSDLVVEGDFETDPTSPWEREGAWWNGVTTSFGIEDGVGVLKFSDDSVCAYCAQIVYNGIDFVEGETYLVTFDAKVLIADQMQVNFWDADDSVNMTGEVLDISTEWQTFEAIITYTQSTGGSLQMQIGSLDDSDDAVITPNILYIDNVSIQKEVSFEDAELILNGDFETASAWNYWIEPMGAFWSGADTEAYLTFWGGAMHAEIIKGGGAGWAIQAYQVVELETTKTYKVTFDAKADEARDIAAWVGFGADADWHPYGGEAVVSLTDTYQTFTFMIVVDVDPLVGDVAQDVQMKFEFGGSVINAEIDNVMIEEYDTVAELVVVDSNLVVEGDFETDPTSPWEREGAWWNGVTTSFGIEDGVGVLKFSDDSICAYCAQIVYNGIDFVEGETYKVTFDAKVLVADQMQINFWDADDSVNMTGEVLDISTEWQTFEAIITYTQSTGGTLQMQIGSLDESDDAVITPNILYIDNVMIDVAVNAEDAVVVVLPETDWTGYGYTVTVDAEVETIAYTAIPAPSWWDVNAQMDVVDFDGTKDSITFTFTGTDTHVYIFKIENGTENTQVEITADGTEQTVDLDLSAMTLEQRNALNLIIFFVTTEAADGSAVITWDYTVPAT